MIKLHSNNNYIYTLQGLSTYILIKEIFHHVKCKYWINELKEFLINFSMIIVPSVQCDGNLPKIFKIIHLKGLSLEFQVILILEGWLKKKLFEHQESKKNWWLNKWQIYCWNFKLFTELWKYEMGPICKNLNLHNVNQWK